MDIREKLIELLAKYFDIGDSYAYNLTRVKSAFACGTMGFDDFEEFDEETVADIADHLINNGITVQEWISVNDRLPEHGDVVVVWHTYMEHPFVCQWDERSDCWIDDKWTFGRNTITHWCYLPQPPKGE